MREKKKGAIGEATWKAEILVRCTEDIESAVDKLTMVVDKHERTATKLSRALNWLTGIIAVAAIAGVMVTVWIALKGG